MKPDFSPLVKAKRAAAHTALEYVKEGIIFVTSRHHCKIAYGALRAILSSEHTLGRRATNLQYALSDARIQEAIKSAYDTTETLESIRKKAERIISSAKGIRSDADEVEDSIRASLNQLQLVIQNTMEDILPCERDLTKTQTPHE